VPFEELEGSLPCSQETITGPSQMNPDHTLKSRFFNIHFSIILAPTPWQSTLSLSSRFPDYNSLNISQFPRVLYALSFLTVHDMVSLIFRRRRRIPPVLN
jgi:hypothetical protein